VNPERLALADALMQQQFDTGRSPMLAAVVARHGEIVFSKTLGDQRPGGPPLTLDSVFPLASNGKPMTAATLLALAERGKVAITHPVDVYIPELKCNDNADVLVHHLLTHTSGWDDEDIVASRDQNLEALLNEPAGSRDVIEHILFNSGIGVPRRHPTGALMSYTNFNYTLIGEIIRRVTGDTLDANMRRYVFDPVGMQSSAVIVPDAMVPRVIERPHGIPLAPGHPDTSVAFYDPLWFALDDGGSGVHSTPLDNLRFLEMVRNGGIVDGERVLSPASIRLMTTNQIPGAPAVLGISTMLEASWSYGFSVGGAGAFAKFRGGFASRGTLRHGGSGGISSWIDPDLRITGVYYEIVTENDAFGWPWSWVAHRFEDVITSAVTD
jgi:CubicO group peptidase (beta-lactamase class C family)